MRTPAYLLVLVLAYPVAVLGQGPIDMDAGGTGDSSASGPGEEQAKAHFRVGQSLYDAGRFTEAAQEWSKAYELSGRAELLYNVYVGYRDANKTALAATALQHYLQRADIDPQQRLRLEAKLQVLQEATADAPEPAPAQATPAPASPAAGGPSATDAAAFDSGHASSSGAAADTGTNLWPWVMVGVGGALAVGGVATGIVVDGKESRLEDRCPQNVCPRSLDLASEQSSIESLALVTDILLIGGIAVAGAGAAWLWFGSDAGQTDTAHTDTTQLACGPAGCQFKTAF